MGNRIFCQHRVDPSFSPYDVRVITEPPLKAVLAGPPDQPEASPPTTRLRKVD